MKKFILTIFLFSFAIVFVYAKDISFQETSVLATTNRCLWSLNWSNIYRLIWNIGIWTSSPESKLHIYGGSFLVEWSGWWTPILGDGTRFMWVPSKKTLVAWSVDNDEWDNIGNYWIIFWKNNKIYNSPFSSILGGKWNEILWTPTSAYMVIAWWKSNMVNWFASSIWGGSENIITRNNATIAWWNNNNIEQWQAGSIWGWSWNHINWDYWTIPGGKNNIVNWQYSFAAWYKAVAEHNGSFVWADSSVEEFVSYGENTFNVKADGGVFLEADVYANKYCNISTKNCFDVEEITSLIKKVEELENKVKELSID